MKTSIRIMHWAPRILCIAAILFISMFALDSFDPRLSLGQQLDAFAMHLLPSFILLLFLAIAWKWERIGGLIFIAIGLGLSPFIYSHNLAINHSIAMSFGIVMVINSPFVVTGILFVISWWMKNKKQAVVN